MIIKKKSIIKIIIIFITILIVPIHTYSAGEDETLESQQDEFKIQDFINSSKEYGGEFFEGMDINEILNSAIKGEVDNSTIVKRILNLLRTRINHKYKINIKHISYNSNTFNFKSNKRRLRK